MSLYQPEYSDDDSEADEQMTLCDNGRIMKHHPVEYDPSKISYVQYDLPLPAQKQTQTSKQQHPNTHYSGRCNNLRSPSSISDLEDDEDEEAPLFSPSNNFNSATADHTTGNNIKGLGYAVDYHKSRAERKEKELHHNLEIECEKKKRHTNNSGNNKWWWWEEEEFDDIDFDEHYHVRRPCSKTNGVVFLLSFGLALMIIEQQYHFLFGQKNHNGGSAGGGGIASLGFHGRSNLNTTVHGASHGSVPASRWGHRFDDDHNILSGGDGDDVVNNIEDGTIKAPKYHSHNHHHNKVLTPEEVKKDLEEWEEFDMEVASLLADSRPDWDVNSNPNLNDGTGETVEDGYTDHWVQYFDSSSQQYYYFHRETNATQWEKPNVVMGVVILGYTYGTGAEYVVEEMKLPEAEVVEETTEIEEDDLFDVDDDFSVEVDADEMSKAVANFKGQDVLDWYSETYWRWNHPYRIAERTEIWGGIDVPVFWRVPLSGATTVEEIFTRCYHIVVAGTTGANKDGQIIRHSNISEHLSVQTLDDGAKYLNINMGTKDGIERARKAGLGQSVSSMSFSRDISTTLLKYSKIQDTPLDVSPCFVSQLIVLLLCFIA
mmetsp:Transcript_12494/g.27332  ORF Transcript_12494/g.27332 Transcript_12494/m.27332 type:complete len:600 (+) Transcript_12494:127-1926(+)